MSIPAIAALEEDNVDDMWLNLGRLYFPITEGYIMTAQSRLRVESGQRADFGVRKVINGNVRVVICEDSAYENMNLALEWKNKREKLKAYCGQTRVAESDFEQTIFGIIRVGKSSQFYKYAFGQSELLCLHSLDEAYSFKSDKAKIDYWVGYIHDQDSKAAAEQTSPHILAHQQL